MFCRFSFHVHLEPKEEMNEIFGKFISIKHCLYRQNNSRRCHCNLLLDLLLNTMNSLPDGVAFTKSEGRIDLRSEKPEENGSIPFFMSCCSGSRLDPVADPRRRAVLQRAGLRALARHPVGQSELARLRRQHPTGHRQVGHAGTDPQPGPMFPTGEAHFLIDRFTVSSSLRLKFASKRVFDFELSLIVLLIYWNIELCNRTRWYPERPFLISLHVHSQVFSLKYETRETGPSHVMVSLWKS